MKWVELGSFSMDFLKLQVSPSLGRYFDFESFGWKWVLMVSNGLG